MKTLSKFAFAMMMLFGVQAAAQETVIDQSQLPANARSFVTKYFSDATVAHAVKDKEIAKTEYEVRLSDGSKMEFDGDGNWKEVESKTQSLSAMTFVPQSIRDYIAKNFPTHQIRKIEKSSQKYEVKLTNGLELEFDLNGKFLRTDD